MLSFQEWWDIHGTTLAEYDIAKAAWEAAVKECEEQVFRELMLKAIRRKDV